VAIQERPETFFAVPRHDDLEALFVTTLKGAAETYRCLFFHVPRARLFELHPPLAEVEFEEPGVETVPEAGP
jgi:hypothetical protein